MRDKSQQNDPDMFLMKSILCKNLEHTSQKADGMTCHGKWLYEPISPKYHIMTWAGEAAGGSEAEVEGEIKEIGCLTSELINTCDSVIMLSN